jgi:hypothetical protein
MLAYGRRHVSLMHIIPAANEAIAIHTILEVRSGEKVANRNEKGWHGANRKWALERGSNPKRSRRTCCPWVRATFVLREIGGRRETAA